MSATMDPLRDSAVDLLALLMVVVILSRPHDGIGVSDGHVTVVRGTFLHAIKEPVVIDLLDAWPPPWTG